MSGHTTDILNMKVGVCGSAGYWWGMIVWLLLSLRIIFRLMSEVISWWLLVAQSFKMIIIIIIIIISRVDGRSRGGVISSWYVNTRRWQTVTHDQTHMEVTRGTIVWNAKRDYYYYYYYYYYYDQKGVEERW